MANTVRATVAESNAAYTQLDAKVKELAKELPGTTFGYIGDLSDWGDGREWFVFLAHPGRVGTYRDRVVLGETASLPAAVSDWDEVVGIARRLYHNGERRA